MNNKKIFDLYSLERELEKQVSQYKENSIINNLPILASILEEAKDVSSGTIYLRDTGNKLKKAHVIKQAGGVIIDNEIFYKKTDSDELLVEFKKNSFIYENDKFILRFQNKKDLTEKELLVKNNSYRISENYNTRNKISNIKIELENEKVEVSDEELTKIGNWSVSKDKYNKYTSDCIVMKNNDKNLIQHILIDPARNTAAIVINDSYLNGLENFKLDMKGATISSNRDHNIIINYEDYKKLIEKNKENIELYQISHDILIIAEPKVFNTSIFNLALSQKKMNIVGELSELLRFKLTDAGEKELSVFFDGEMVDLINNEKAYPVLRAREVFIKPFNIHEKSLALIKTINEEFAIFEKDILSKSIDKKIEKILFTNGQNTIKNR